MAVTPECGNYKTFEVSVRAFSCFSWTTPKIPKQKKGQTSMLFAPYSCTLQYKSKHLSPQVFPYKSVDKSAQRRCR